MREETQYCLICESYAAERDALRKDVERLKAPCSEGELHQACQCLTEYIQAKDAEIDALKQKATTIIDDKILCPDCEAPCTLGKRMDGSTYLKHPVYACPKQIQEELSKTDAEAERLRKALLNIMNNLGVPGPSYPYPVAHAYDIAKAALEAGK